MNPQDWTCGGQHLHVQQCDACGHVWYFERSFCPACGHTAVQVRQVTGLGVVYATTVVHRAPSDAFRAITPYRMVLVDLDAGVRVMGHAESELEMGQRVRCEVRDIAGQSMPYFLKASDDV
jgi:uncharacterized OB-fold protein